MPEVGIDRQGKAWGFMRPLCSNSPPQWRGLLRSLGIPLDELACVAVVYHSQGMGNSCFRLRG